MPEKKRKPFSEVLAQVAVVKPEEVPQHELYYLPILKGKAGELTALEELNINIKSKILPLVEVPPVPWDYVNEKFAKTTSNHVKGFHKKLIETWGVDYPVILDTALLEDDIMDGMLAMDYLLSELHSQGVEAIPVIRLTDKKEYRAIVKKNLKNVKRACLRITAEDIDNFDLAVTVSELLTDLALTKEEVDLLIDFKDVTNNTASIFLPFAKMIIGSFPDITKYNTFSLAMTSFPENLSDFDGGTVATITRIEWNLWNELDKTNLKRIPTFSDYGISSTEIADVDPRIMQMSASIRYTWEDNWVIVKGRSVKKHSFDQFYELSKRVVASRFFYGANYSWGDKSIDEKAKLIGGTGNATTWRQIGTNHHITVVVNQIDAKYAF